MKKVLLILLLVFSFSLHAQVSNTKTVRIDNATTAFGKNISIGTLVYNVATGELFAATAAVLNTATLTTASASFDVVGGIGDVTQADDSDEFFHSGSGATSYFKIGSITLPNPYFAIDAASSSIVNFADEVWFTETNASGGYGTAKFDLSGKSGTNTFTFPDVNGVFALEADASGFNGILATTDNTLQEIAEVVDNIVGMSIATIGEINTGSIDNKAISPLGFAGSDYATDITANNSKVTFPEAPLDGDEYVRKNGGWEIKNTSKDDVQIPLDYSIVENLTDFDALITASTTGTWLITGAFTLDANKTIPTDVTLEFRSQNPIDLSTFTLTGNNTKILAGPYKIFGETGVYAGTWDVVEVLPQWFGAVGDNVNDDTAELQAACDFIADVNDGKDNLNLNGRKYKITDTVNLGICNVYFNGSEINYAGTQDRSAVVWGSTTTIPTKSVLRDVFISAETLSWTNNDYKGLTIYNALSCSIEITQIIGFNTGLQLISVSGGVTLNSFYLKGLWNNKYALDMLTDGVLAATNYINENNFFGGDFNYTSSTLSLGDCYGVRFRQINSGYTGHNNNKFWGCSFQMGDGLGGDERIPVYMDDVGNNNFFYTSRYETGRGAFAKLNATNNAIVNNTFEVSVLSGSYVTATIEEIGKSRMNYIKAETWKSFNTFQTQDLLQNILVYNGTNVQATGNIHLLNSGGTILNYTTGYTARKESVLVSGSRAIGFFVNTNGDENFVVSQEAEADDYGRLMIALYDEDFNRLTDVSTGAPHFAGKEVGDPHVWTSSFGGAYTAGSDIQSMPFRISADVKYIQVIVGGTGKLKSISLTRVSDTEKPLHVFSGRDADYTQRLTEGTLSTGEMGVFERGNVLYRATAAVGQPSFYQCTQGGRLAAGWVTATAYDVNSIVETGGNVYTCVTAGTSASAPTGTGTGIADGTVVWDYLSKKALFTSSVDILAGNFSTGSHTVNTNLSIATTGEINTGTIDNKAISPLGFAGSDYATNITANNAKVTDDDLGVSGVYNNTWDGDNNSTTKNDVYDKIELLSGETTENNIETATINSRYYAQRALDNGGVFESLDQLDYDLSNLTTETIQFTPNAVNEDTLYTIQPNRFILGTAADFDFTRASISTRVNSQKLIERVTDNTPRIDYKNTNSGVLLIEGVGKNELQYSEALDNAFWVQSRTTVIADDIISPDGTKTADRYTDTSDNATHRSYSGIVSKTVASEKFTASAFFKAGNSDLTGVLKLTDANSSDSAYIAINLSDGTTLNETDGTNYSVISSSVEPYPNGWYRLIVNYQTPVSITTPDHYVRLHVSLGNASGAESFAGTGSDYIYVWGIQLEKSDNASSYIPTTSAATTRPLEFVNGGGDATLINSEAGVLYIESAALFDDITDRIITISDGTKTNEVYLGYDAFSNRIQAGYINNTTDYKISFVVPDETVMQKIAFKWATNDLALWIDGIEVDATATAVMVAADTFNELQLAEGDGTDAYEGKLRELKVFTEALSDLELTALTTKTDYNPKHLARTNVDPYFTKDVTVQGSITSLGNKVLTSNSKSITIGDPTATEDISMFFTNKAITITEIRAVLIGSSTPSVTWTIRHDTDRSATGTEVVISGTATTSTTTGSDVTTFNDATIPLDSFVWVETTAQSGTVGEISLTIIYTED